MKQILASILALILAGCSLNKAPVQEATVQDKNMTQKPAVIQPEKKETKIAVSNAIFSTFHTILPCPDCEGIKTILTLNKDKTYVKSMLYIAKDPKFSQEVGTFEINANIITLKSADGKTQFFTPHKNSLIQLDENKNKRTGVLADIYSFEPVDKGYKESFFRQFFKFKNEKSFQSVIITPFKDGARLDAYSSLKDGEPPCSLDGTLSYKDGIFYLKNENGLALSVHKIHDNIFIKNEGKNICKRGYIAGKYSQKTSLKWLFGKHFLGVLTDDMKSSDIIKIFGSKNIKRDANLKDENSYIVFDSAKNGLFKYTLLNGIITQIELLTPKFKTPEGISIGSNFGEIKNALKIENFTNQNGKISLKIPTHDIVIKLKTTKNIAIKGLSDIPDDTKIDKILLIWNQ